ncbi:Hypothetical predicted protein [Cloeon dipterum]|uniref:DOMON domain-containing protein n=1 Tax=Cloeon dipterum TaxID=197152 RepID=A0A8S1CEK8_9INSE|nr:Hypothetical predicted protein [Cloeon dipterum]
MFVFLAILVAIVNVADARVFNIPLDPSGNITLHWLPDYSEEKVTFEVHFHTESSAQWLAVGFSDYGETTLADYCLYWVDWKGGTHLTDTWTDKDGKFREDEMQNCEDFKIVSHKSQIKFSFARKFDTCDENDYVIEDGTTHVVWSFGDGPLYRINGLSMAEAKSGFQRTQLLKALIGKPNFPPDTHALYFTSDRAKVPSDETTYWCHVHLLPAAMREKKHHVLQFGPAIQKGNEPLVHHMELFHCELPAQQKVPSYQGPCFAPDKPALLDNCKRVLSAWAMGAEPFDYPEEAGLPIGGPDFNPYVMLEVHYNNPELKSDWIDSSGIKLLVTPTLRPLDAGVMELGLEYIDKMAIPPSQPSFLLSGYCISECTAVSLDQEGIVIFASQLHTHLTGTRVETRHIRDGREQPLLNQDRHYSTHFQEIRKLKRPVRVLPGDALVTTCFYNTEDRTNITLGGFSISDEMCVNYVHYYPKSRLEVCKSSVSYQSLWDYFRFMRDWDGQKTLEPQGAISNNYGSIDWTPARANVLQQMYLESPLSMQCNQSNGERFPGEWENTPLTTILFPLPPKARPACEL